MIVIALSSGTSADGIDVAVADFSRESDVLVLRPLGHNGYPYSSRLREAIIAAAPPALITAEQVCRIDTAIGQEFAAVASKAAVELAAGQAELVVSHGQTFFHWIDDGAPRGTLQLGQPAWIAEATGLPVVSDVRVNDVAAGGHGAPLAGLFDALLLADRPLPAAALNLGGIANVTVLRSGEPALAFDTGPANALLDAAVRRITGGQQDVDTDGKLAARGTVDESLLEVLLDEPYYRLDPPKSTGKELFDAGYLDRALARVGELADEDILATLAELTAVTVASAVRPYRVSELMASGGGTRHPVVMRGLAELLAPTPVRPADDLGIDGDAKEAYLFALIGYLTWHGLPGSLPSCTGARRAPIAGRITPGATPLRMPEPAATAPTRMRVAARPTARVGWTSDALRN